MWQTERVGTAVLIRANHDGRSGERVLYFATLAAAMAGHDSNDAASADIGTTVRLRPSATMRWSDAFEATVTLLRAPCSYRKAKSCDFCAWWFNANVSRTCHRSLRRSSCTPAVATSSCNLRHAG